MQITTDRLFYTNLYICTCKEKHSRICTHLCINYTRRTCNTHNIHMHLSKRQLKIEYLCDVDLDCYSLVVVVVVLHGLLLCMSFMNSKKCTL